MSVPIGCGCMHHIGSHCCLVIGFLHVLAADTTYTRANVHRSRAHRSAVAWSGLSFAGLYIHRHWGCQCVVVRTTARPPPWIPINTCECEQPSIARTGESRRPSPSAVDTNRTPNRLSLQPVTPASATHRPIISHHVLIAAPCHALCRCGGPTPSHPMIWGFIIVGLPVLFVWAAQ